MRTVACVCFLVLVVGCSKEETKPERKVEPTKASPICDENFLRIREGMPLDDVKVILKGAMCIEETPRRRDFKVSRDSKEVIIVIVDGKDKVERKWKEGF